MRGHIDFIRLHFNTIPYHVISVSETWLHAGVSDDLVALDGYFLIRNDRVGNIGGGVACYLHKSLRATIVAASSGGQLNDPEYLIIDIRLPLNEPILFASIYRRPKGNLLQDFVRSLTSVSHLYKNIIIGGDLNCNLLSNQYEATYLRQLMFSLSLYIIPSDATHHTATSNSCLDVLIVDDSDKVLSFAKSSSPFIAGHDLLSLSLSLFSPINTERSYTRRCFRNINVTEFCEFLSISVNNANCTRTNLSREAYVQESSTLLSCTLRAALDVFAPTRSFVSRGPPLRWLTEELKSRLRVRNTLFKQAKRSNSLLGFLRYRLFRNQLNLDIKRAKSEFFLGSLNNITEPAKLWRELARLGLVKSTLVSPLHFFSLSQLNSYYTSVSSAVPLCFSDFISAISCITCPPCQSEFVFSLVTPNSIYKLITAHPLHSYASGADGIPLFILRIAWPCISSWLTDLFNNSLKLSSFPSEWKNALIRPLSKIRKPLSPSDTRPIANLPELSKTLERIVADQIVDYLNSNNILDPRQSAYRSGFNTQSALLRICNDVRAGIDGGLITIMVLFDFSKAFDTVPHLYLLIKLKKLGFSDSVVTWFYSYLTCRSQAVIDDEGNRSEWLHTSLGVPQGSVLGPLLFLLFINDISNVLSFTSHMLFADDLQIYLSCPPADILRGLELISRDVNAIFDYTIVNGLRLNLTKSKAIILGSQKHVNCIDTSLLPPIIVDCTPLLFVSEVRNLGVIFTSNLSWHKHIIQVSKNVHHALYKLKFNRNSLY